MVKRSISMSFVLVMTGCAMIGGGQEHDPRPVAALWRADIRSLTPHGHSGFATGSILPTGETRMNVTLDGGSAGGVHPWSVHEGECRQLGSVVGPVEAYPVLRPDARGDASATATLDTALDPASEYSILVGQGDDPDAVVGCGELERAW